MSAARGRLAAVLVLALVGAALPVQVNAATPPDTSTSAVPKPPELALRLPWKSGESHVIGAWRYNDRNAFGDLLGGDHKCLSGSQDCYALDIVSSPPRSGGLPPLYPFTTSTAIVTTFPGKVVFAGCAVGGWKNYGQVAYIETRIGSYIYGALYAHLSKLATVNGRRLSAGMSVGRNQVIGNAGGTRNLDGDCSPSGLGNQPGNVHLHFAIYRYDPNSNAETGQVDATTGVHKANWWLGGPRGGQAVVPEPLIGDQIYENFRWWNDGTSLSPPMTAVDLTSSGGPICPKIDNKPTCKWTGTQTDVGPGEMVEFKLRAQAKTPLKEVHLTAWYDPNGSAAPASWNAADSRFVGFTPDRIWRIVAICRPPPPNYSKATYKDGNGCVWTNMKKNADRKVIGANLARSFDPTLGGAPPRNVTWLPDAVKPWPTNGQCVPMKISFNVYDTAGGVKLAGDRVMPTTCSSAVAPSPVATVRGAAVTPTIPQANVVYLRPSGVPSKTPYVLSSPVQLSASHPMTVAPDGSLWVSGSGTNDQVGSLTRISVIGEQTEVELPDGGCPGSLAIDTSARLWFADVCRGAIGLLAASGQITEYPTPGGEVGGNYNPYDLVAGPDGAMWYADNSHNVIGRVAANGDITTYPALGNPTSIAWGSDGNLWFNDWNEPYTEYIGVMSPQGQIVHRFALPSFRSYARSLISGPDGNIWFAEWTTGNIGRITPAGVISEFHVADESALGALAFDPSGKLWFVGLFSNIKLGQLTPSTGVVTYVDVSGFGALAVHPDGLWMSGLQTPSGPHLYRIAFD